MSSPRSRTQTEFDATIGRELRNWGDRQQAPAAVRNQILQQASETKTARQVRFRLKALRPFRRLRFYLFEASSLRLPDLPYSELTRWLHAQAAWQHLGNDRRSARFVC